LRDAPDYLEKKGGLIANAFIVESCHSLEGLLKELDVLLEIFSQHRFCWEFKHFFFDVGTLKQ